MQSDKQASRTRYLFQSPEHCMKIILGFTLLIMSMACLAQERGRVYFDHMSIAPPADWQLSILGNKIMLVAPFRIDTLYDRCSISINVAGATAGGPIGIIGQIDSNMPGNLDKENIPPVQTLQNGWQATERIYRNRYVRSIYTRVIVATKNGVGQVLTVSNALSGCQAFTDPIVKTVQINDQPNRLQASGAPIKLLEASPQDIGRGSGGTKAGTVCRAGGISCLNGGPIGSSCMCASTAGPQLGTVF
jgi:hypothetical protein